MDIDSLDTPFDGQIMLDIESRIQKSLVRKLNRIKQTEQSVVAEIVGQVGPSAKIASMVHEISSAPAGTTTPTTSVAEEIRKVMLKKMESIQRDCDAVISTEMELTERLVSKPDWFSTWLEAKIENYRRQVNQYITNAVERTERMAQIMDRERLAALTVDELNIPSALLSKTGKIEFASKSIYSLVGVQMTEYEEPLVGRNICEFMDSSDGDILKAKLEQVTSADSWVASMVEGVKIGPAGSLMEIGVQVRKVSSNQVIFVVGAVPAKSNNTVEVEKSPSGNGENPNHMTVSLGVGEYIREECRIRDILRSIAAPVVVADSSMVIEFVNQYGCDVFGYALDEMVGKRVNMLMSASAADAHDGFVANYRRGTSKIVGKKPRLVHGKDRNGKELLLYLTLTEANDKFTAVFTDVTKEYTSEYKLKNVISASTVPVVTVNSETMKIVKTNNAAINMFGYGKEELVDLHVSEIFGEENAKKYRWEVWSGKRHDGYVVVTEEYGRRKCTRVVGRGPHMIEAKTKSGSTIYLYVSATFTDKMFTAVCTNMTEAHLAVKRVNDILSSVACPVVVASSQMVIEYVNDKTVEVFGYDRTELLGERVEILMPDKEAETHQQHVDHLVNGGPPRIIGQRPRHVLGKRRDGSLVSLLLTITRSGDSFTAVFTEVPNS